MVQDISANYLLSHDSESCDNLLVAVGVYKKKANQLLYFLLDSGRSIHEKRVLYRYQLFNYTLWRR